MGGKFKTRGTLTAKAIQEIFSYMDSLKKTLQKKGLLDPNSSSQVHQLSNDKFNASKHPSQKNSKNEFDGTEEYVRKKDFKDLRNQLNELKQTLGASKFNLDASRRQNGKDKYPSTPNVATQNGLNNDKYNTHVHSTPNELNQNGQNSENNQSKIPEQETKPVQTPPPLDTLLAKQLSDIEDQLDRMKSQKYDDINNLRAEFAEQLRLINEGKMADPDLIHPNKKKKKEEEPKKEPLPSVESRRVDAFGNDIKYLMDEVHRMQETIYALQQENKSMTEKLESQKKAEKNPEEEQNAVARLDKDKDTGFDLNRYIGVYEGMDEVMKLDKKLSHFIDHQTILNKRVKFSKKISDFSSRFSLKKTWTRFWEETTI